MPRSSPVLSIPDGKCTILVGSNWGRENNPNWVYNLRANPQANVRRGKNEMAVNVRELNGDEREKYWNKAVAFYPPYVSYEKRAKRLLPIFLLEPLQNERQPDESK